MNTVTAESISAKRRALQDKTCIKRIQCPFDPESGHEATVYTHGHTWSGIIECDVCEVEDGCEHENTHTENIEVTSFMTPDHDTSYNTDIEICDTCECSIERP
jgi:hypothetical protein